MSNNSVEKLRSKIRFSSVLKTSQPLPPNNIDFSISKRAQTTAPTQQGTGGTTELTLAAKENKNERLNIEKCYFLEVSRLLLLLIVARCS